MAEPNGEQLSPLGQFSLFVGRGWGQQRRSFSMRDYSRKPLTHRDALEFSDGQIVILTGLFEHRNSAPASSAIRYTSQAKA
jgi:hypothetical protein